MSKLSIALLGVILLLGSVTLFGNNIFKAADSFNIALDKAKTNRKLLLTYAASSNAPCCIAMEKATFKDPEVQNLLNASFYPIKINLSNALGKQWADRFQIINSPTLLFFDTNGTLIKQIENGVSSTELKSILNDVLFFNLNGYWSMEGHPVVLTTTVMDQPTISTATKIEAKSCPHQNQSKSCSKSCSKISILIDRIPTDDPMIKKTVEKIKLQYPNQPLRIKLAKGNQKAFYHVLLGKFNSTKDAEFLLEEVIATFNNAQLSYPHTNNP